MRKNQRNKKILKSLIFSALVGSVVNAADLTISFASFHLFEERLNGKYHHYLYSCGHHYINEFNPGLIVTRDDGYKFGVYRNSVGKTSFFVGCDFTDHFSLSLVSGYPELPILPVPSLYWKYGRLRVDVAIDTLKLNEKRVPLLVFGFSFFLSSL